MTYPAQPNFDIAASDSAWFKVNNPGANMAFICQTNGAGFVNEAKASLSLWASQGLIGRLQRLSQSNYERLRAIPDLYSIITSGAMEFTSPDGARPLALTDSGIGQTSPVPGAPAYNSKWTQTFQGLIAAWFRRINSAPVTIVPGAGIADRYEALVTGLSPAMRMIHDRLRDDYVAQRVSVTSLRVAAWAITYHRDLAAGARQGGGGPLAIGMQLTPFEDIAINSDAAPPPWDAELPGGAQAIVCAQERVGTFTPVPTGRPTARPSIFSLAAWRFSGIEWAKLLGLTALAGGGGFVIAKMAKPKKKRRKK
jgi:hypothetical protein